MAVQRSDLRWGTQGPRPPVVTCIPCAFPQCPDWVSPWTWAEWPPVLGLVGAGLARGAGGRGGLSGALTSGRGWPGSHLLSEPYLVLSSS